MDYPRERHGNSEKPSREAMCSDNCVVDGRENNLSHVKQNKSLWNLKGGKKNATFTH